MNKDNRLQKINKKIESLPVGNITYKNIRGKNRMYLQWTQDGKQKSKYIQAKEESKIISQINERNNLLEEYDKLIRQENVHSKEYNFETSVIIGEDLKRLCNGVKQYKKRECFQILSAFLSSTINGKLCLLYGLRRTGKTTMLLQAISSLGHNKVAYIKINTADNMAMLNRDLRKLINDNYKYIFIDEATLLADFIDSASLLSDVYALSGVKIVLSGTDSLGFVLSMDNELYDRAILIHTTYIPFREYSRLLGINDVDEYIRYGGTFKVGETNFDDITFKDDLSTRKYIDTAIAHNIQHSLANYQFGSHFRHLKKLYEQDELTNVINRIIEDMNHDFLLSVIQKDIVSNDLGSSSQMLRKKAVLKNEESTIDNIDVKNFTKRLMNILSIKNKNNLNVEVNDEHIKEIKEYLLLLDLIINCPIETIGTSATEHMLFCQPGMRYCQAQALVFSLLKDEKIKQLSKQEQKYICDKILEDVKGRMLEEIVLLETNLVLPTYKRAFKLQFAIGEYDMVIYDEENDTCELYEIKHSNTIVEDQYNHLVDENMCRQTSKQYGTITNKIVLYRGVDSEVNGIKYRNVETYLNSL